MIDEGTKSNIASECRLDSRNMQFPVNIGLFSKSKISWFNSLVDLKEQSTHCGKNRSVRVLKIFKLKK